ncbi:MAG: parvulin peptidyl-prolyl isomerase, partial [Massilibacteroides sp.]|nr:parvulin peptidyl-prolyl isomerase [Massilibacteroides sp.]
MKKIFISLFLMLLLVSPLYALPKDSIVMTVAGHPVSLDEFLFIAHKNTNVDLSDKNSIDNFVTLFKNFKLKVAEAEEKGYDKFNSFKTEL